MGTKKVVVFALTPDKLLKIQLWKKGLIPATNFAYLLHIHLSVPQVCFLTLILRFEGKNYGLTTYNSSKPINRHSTNVQLVKEQMAEWIMSLLLKVQVIFISFSTIHLCFKGPSSLFWILLSMFEPHSYCFVEKSTNNSSVNITLFNIILRDIFSFSQENP
jgi:hypothetical protein